MEPWIDLEELLGLAGHEAVERLERSGITVDGPVELAGPFAMLISLRPPGSARRGDHVHVFTRGGRAVGFRGDHRDTERLAERVDDLERRVSEIEQQGGGTKTRAARKRGGKS